MSGNSLHFSSAWTSVHIIVVVHDGVIDDCGTVDDFNLGAVMRIGSIVSVHISMIDATMRDKYPVSGWDIDAHIDRYAGAKWGPTVVSATCPPAHPGRRPFIAGNPCPRLIVVIKVPAPVVERRPAPIIV